MIKICKKCNKEQPIDNFHKGARMKDGYLNICKTCRTAHNTINKETISKQRAKHYKDNKERISGYQKEYSATHSERKNQVSKNYYQTNKDTLKTKKKEYYQANKTKTNKRERDKKKENPLYKLTTNIRAGVSKSFKRNGYPKNSKTEKILGCTFKELKTHLEIQFKDWMTWQNYGLYNGELNYGWDIDHIIPLCTANNEGELIILCHHKNLQPLCSKNNRDIKRGGI